MADLLGILRIKDSNGNWVSVPGLKGDTGEPFKILGIYATAADLEVAVTDPGVGDVYLVGTTGAYDIYLYLLDGWHNTGRYMPKGDQGDPAPAASITSAVETWLAANVDPETGYVLDRTLSLETAAAPADLVGDLNNALHTVEGILGGEYSKNVSFTDGRAVNNGTGATVSSGASSYSDYIPCEGYESIVLTMPKYNLNYARGLAFYSANDGTGYISGVRSNYDTEQTEAITSELRTIPIPQEAKYFCTTWVATTYESYSSMPFSCRMAISGTLDEELKTIESKLYAQSENVLNQTTLTLDAYINNQSGTQGSSTNYAVTDYIPVSSGDVIAAFFNAQNMIALRYVAAYDSSKILMPNSGGANINSYTVPEGVSFIRISGNKARLTNALARITRRYVSGEYVFYEPYFNGELPAFAANNRSAIETLKGYPLTKLPQYIINNLAYKPLGPLSKGYVCFVSDDGDAELATYTIPMFIAKGVPGTWAVMRSSTVWNTQAGIDTVIDSVQNHGCCLAQHGGSSWEQDDELSLNTFFDAEKAYWDDLGVSVYGAVCPAHDINDMIRCVAGGRFLCLRTGYNDAKPRYANYCNGPRSNIFGLCSQSSLDGTVASQSAALDLAKENHWLRILHFHENEMDAAAKARLEAIIDYAKSIELTFVTMEDIPWLI